MQKNSLLLFILFLSSVLSLRAKNDSTSASADTVAFNAAWTHEVDSLLNTLQYQTGHLSVGTIAAVDVPEGFKYLSGKDSYTVLSKLWNNPPDLSILGMLVPDSIDYFDASSWVIAYSYEEDGHVKDDDAESINYTDLLKEMKEDTKNDNEKRIKDGYSAIELVGWAQEPFYDKTTHKLHWAKELRVGDDSATTLNYNIRMLGRKGVLVLNIIAGMDNLHVVKSQMNTILASTNFTSGNSYEDFDDKIDKVAEYGIGGLIAGAVLVKTGLLAKLGLILLKAWKFIALGLAGLLSFFRKKIFNKKE